MPAVAIHTEICEAQIHPLGLGDWFRWQWAAAGLSSLVATAAVFGISTAPAQAHHPLVFTIAIGAIALGCSFNRHGSTSDGTSAPANGWLAIAAFLAAAVAGSLCTCRNGIYRLLS